MFRAAMWSSSGGQLYQYNIWYNHCVLVTVRYAGQDGNAVPYWPACWMATNKQWLYQILYWYSCPPEDDHIVVQNMCRIQIHISLKKTSIIFPLNGIMSFPCICLMARHIYGTMYRVASICFCIFQRCTSHRTMYMPCHKTYTWKWHDSIKGEYDTQFIFMRCKWQSCTLWPIKDVGIGKMLWDLIFCPLKNKCWLLLSKETHTIY